MAVLKTIQKYRFKLVKMISMALLMALRDPALISCFLREITTLGLRSAINKALLATSVNLSMHSSYHYQEDFDDREIIDFIDKLTYRPIISIVMPVRDIDPKWLDLAIGSVKAQLYKNWELLIVDDASEKVETLNFLSEIKDPAIKIKFLEKNLGISGASNEAIAMSSGEYVALLDHDDELTRDALFEIVKALNELEIDFVYSDEDLIDRAGRCFHPHFKPDYSPDLLLSHNYITHLSVAKKSILEELGAMRGEFDGAQDYDLFLRVVERADKIHHIPKVLYHWRTLESSTSLDSSSKNYAKQAAKRALESTLSRRRIVGQVFYGEQAFYYHTRREVVGAPLVSIIIAVNDDPDLFKKCLESIISKSSYSNYEIIAVAKRSVEANSLDFEGTIDESSHQIRFFDFEETSNSSKINNFALGHAEGEHVIFLNNGIEIISEDWIESLLEHSQRSEVGAVGAKLLSPDKSIWHAGIIVGENGAVGYSHRGYSDGDPGYFNRLNCVRNVSALSFSCLMIKKKLFLKADGMDETLFHNLLGGVDFCLRLRGFGYYNVYTPHCKAFQNSCDVDTLEPVFGGKEAEELLKRHSEIIKSGDPFFNPNLTLDM